MGLLAVPAPEPHPEAGIAEEVPRLLPITVRAALLRRPSDLPRMATPRCRALNAGAADSGRARAVGQPFFRSRSVAASVV